MMTTTKTVTPLWFTPTIEQLEARDAAVRHGLMLYPSETAEPYFLYVYGDARFYLTTNALDVQLLGESRSMWQRVVALGGRDTERDVEFAYDEFAAGAIMAKVIALFNE
jgi:hypothetical protein